ncbi:unnamed protein product [Tuber melanosporum]|jgi:hypothetical protein|uniref:(Perigord truffle) hypothetical protein n=1 Tax=Tuber melanosporum (strain Mel28) TaxID=656061 RepID=D5G3V1_TUBMM|nr:uncharacterized protein GSTUM_00003815001 [Tuber melanosporum]CAZ79194.1 unnamed protein product [Tuber melanosporum]
MPQQQPIPDSWIFDIYEDTVEETLQNLVEFSTHTLDISDNEETSGELDLGKENIPPSRLAEILSTPRENRMSVDAPVKCIPQRQTPAIGPGGRAPRVRREPLREMKEEELVQPGKKTAQDEDMIKKVMNGKEEMQSDKITTTITMTKLPTLSNDSFITFSTPKKIKRKPLLRTTPSPGWKIWESDHDDDANDDNENLPPLPPATKGDLEMPLLAGTRRKRALGE